MTVNSPRRTEPLEISINELLRQMNCASYNGEIAVLDAKGPFKQTMCPVRIDALFLCLCTRGSCSMKISLQNYEIANNSSFILSPKDYLVVHECSPDFEAKILVCSHPIVEQILPKLTELLPFILNHPMDPIITLSEVQREHLIEYYDLLQQRINGPDTPFKKMKVTCLLQSAMFEMFEIRHSLVEGDTHKKSRKEQIMAGFIMAVSEHFREHRDVAYYADRLCITPKHLSAVVKEISGRPAGDWIDQYVIMEAKVMLKTTDYTVQQISSILNFANQSFFGKYFKHIVGMSPSAFRNTAT